MNTKRETFEQKNNIREMLLHLINEQQGKRVGGGLHNRRGAAHFLANFSGA